MNESDEDVESTLRRLCTCIIGFLSSHATDPHLYFALKMSREVSNADSVDGLTELTNRLLDWVETLDLPTSQIARLDTMLSAEGLPPFSVIRSTDDRPDVHQLVRVLAGAV